MVYQKIKTRKVISVKEKKDKDPKVYAVAKKVGR